MSNTPTVDKFFSSFFNERSPLYTTFVLSWIGSNWKFFYVTLFISADQIPACFDNKLDYAASYLWWWPSALLPLLVTGLLIWGFPFIGIWAYQASLDFRRKRRQRRYDTLERTKLYTYDEVQNLLEGYQTRDANNLAEIQRIDGMRKVAEELLAAVRLKGKAFKLLVAQFGAFTRWHDVTADVQSLVDGGPSLMVTPNAFRSGDPVIGQLKHLIIVYQDGDGNKKFAWALEGDKVIRKENSFLIEPGQATKTWKSPGEPK